MARINKQSVLSAEAQKQAAAAQKTASAARYNTTSPVVSRPALGVRTREGAVGFTRDAKSELYLLAVANFAGEDTFYEKADARNDRFRALIRQVAAEDPWWVVRMLRWLRSEANIRTASIIGAVEFVKARIDAKAKEATVAYTEVPWAFGRDLERAAIDSVCQRPDEPGEVLAYWTSRYGRTIPKPVKRGVADAASRLYNEWSLLKYDTGTHAFRFGDVIRLSEPKITDVVAARVLGSQDPGRVYPWLRRTRDLFKYAINQRNGRPDGPGEYLTVIAGNKALREALAANPNVPLTPELLRSSGMTWENILSLVGSKVDKKVLWEALIPTMGYMALVRNLRNFDEAGVSNQVANQVIAKLTSPEEVARSRQFPFRFLSAHKATAGSLRWGYALEQALSLSLANVPELPGRSLILVDLSGSMLDKAGGKLSDMTRREVATLFGSALALRAKDPTLVWFDTSSGQVPVRKGTALLNLVNSFPRAGGGTSTGTAVARWFDGHDRVIIVTDEQAHDYGGYSIDHAVPKTVPVYVWNLAGYKVGSMPSGSGNRHTFGGLTDESFKLIPMLETAQNASWPF